METPKKEMLYNQAAPSLSLQTNCYMLFYTTRVKDTDNMKFTLSCHVELYLEEKTTLGYKWVPRVYVYIDIDEFLRIKKYGNPSFIIKKTRQHLDSM